MSTDASLSEILSTKVTAKTVTQVAACTSEIVNLFGFQGNEPGSDGRNVKRVGHRAFGYDIFNDARTSAMASAPGTSARAVRRQKVGRVEGTFPRFYEKLPLLLDELHNFRRIGGPASEYDEVGKDFVRKQQRYLGQRLANARLMLTAGMMRGSLYEHQTGDDTFYNFDSTSAVETINWRIPAGNQAQLNMLGAGSIIDADWATASTNIPNHLAQINAAFQNLAGTQLKLIVMNSVTWQYVINNTAVARQAGTSSTPFETFKREAGMGTNGRPLTNQMATLKACPFYDIVITDAVVEVQTTGAGQGTTTTVKVIPDGYVWFGPEPTPEIMEMCLGSEPVNEGYGKATTVQFGSYAWTKEIDDPACMCMYSLDNAIPALYVPKSTAYARVSGF
jgi:hypothetical protein